jgi:hypothetical protein
LTDANRRACFYKHFEVYFDVSQPVLDGPWYSFDASQVVEPAPGDPVGRINCQEIPLTDGSVETSTFSVPTDIEPIFTRSQWNGTHNVPVIEGYSMAVSFVAEEIEAPYVQYVKVMRNGAPSWAHMAPMSASAGRITVRSSGDGRMFKCLSVQRGLRPEVNFTMNVTAYPDSSCEDSTPMLRKDDLSTVVTEIQSSMGPAMIATLCLTIFQIIMIVVLALVFLRKARSSGNKVRGVKFWVNEKP